MHSKSIAVAIAIGRHKGISGGDMTWPKFDRINSCSLPELWMFEKFPWNIQCVLCALLVRFDFWSLLSGELSADERWVGFGDLKTRAFKKLRRGPPNSRVSTGREACFYGLADNFNEIYSVLILVSRLSLRIPNVQPSDWLPLDLIADRFFGSFHNMNDHMWNFFFSFLI